MHHSRFDIGQAGILKTANLDISIDCAPYYSSIWNPSEGSSSSSGWWYSSYNLLSSFYESQIHVFHPFNVAVSDENRASTV